MFILRTITKDSIELVSSLDDQYTIIDREINYNTYCFHFKKVFKRNHVADLDESSDKNSKNCYGFVITRGGVIPLFKENQNYIMTENGKTFDNITYK